MRVLVLDDAQLNITLLRHLIKKLPDCEIVGFIDPFQAIEWCHDNEPDLVVVDYMMPQMDGIEFVKRFQHIAGCEDIPIVMVTANHEADVRYAALSGGVTEFFTKPLEVAEFLERIRKLLVGRQSQKSCSDA